MATKLQTPPYVYFGGEIRPWREATFHISTEAVVRGLNVFEGLKAYWQNDGQIGIVEVESHWRRLRQSARLLHIPFEMTLQEFDDKMHALIAVLCRAESDIWIRATLYVVDGHWGEWTVSDLVLTAYHQDKAPPTPVDIGVSTWRRPADVALPARIKTSANYLIARLAKIEGRGRGYAEMILLNDANRVAEALGSCVLMARNGTIVTPPASEGALESITVNIIEKLCSALGIPFVRRPIERTELYIADEVALVGTLVEVTPVRSIDGFQVLKEHGVIARLQEEYLSAARGMTHSGLLDLSLRDVAQRTDGSDERASARAQHIEPESVIDITYRAPS
jgi:branched-chain amino acid aminotransferase